MSKFFDGLEKYIYWTSIPKIGLNDIVDILIVSVMIYLIVKWIKTTRAWVLLKGIFILLCIAFAAYLLQLHTVSWILSNTMSVGITAILIVFQPELRSALEQLGRKNWVTDIFSTDSRQEELEREAEEENIPILRRAERKLLLEAAAAADPKRILEVGTAIGYSALFLAEHFPLAEIDTIEIDALRNERAVSVMQAAGFEQRVRCHLGDAGEVLSALAGPYDFVYLDEIGRASCRERV